MNLIKSNLKIIRLNKLKSAKLFALAIILAYFLATLGWDTFYNGNISEVWIQNTWFHSISYWLIFIMAAVLVSFLISIKKFIQEKYILSIKRLAFLILASFFTILLPLFPLTISEGNYFYFLKYFQIQSFGWQLAIWAWLVSLFLVWFLPINLPKKINSIINSKWFLWFLLLIFFSFFIFQGFFLLKNLTLIAFDFGIYDQTLWQLAYRFSTANTINGSGNSFGLHFQPILFLLAPFYRIWNNPRMLIILEVAIVVLGAIPIYRLSIRRIGKPGFSIALIFTYLLFEGNIAALVYHFHPSTFIAPLLLFAYDYFDQRRWGLHFLFIGMAFLTKENVGIYIASFGLILLLVQRQFWKLGLVYIISGIAWLLITTQLILPAIRGEEYPFFFYRNLGDNPYQVFVTFIRNPLYIIKTMFDSETKVNTFSSLLSSTGFLSLFSPYIILVLPNLAEKLLSTSITMPLLFNQYGAPLAFGITIGTLEAAARIKSWWDNRSSKWLNGKEWISVVIIVLIIGTIGINVKYELFFNIWQDRKIDIFPEKQEFKDALSLIPKNAKVSAQSAIVPQIAHREFIFDYPVAKDSADYIILSIYKFKGTLSEKDYKKSIISLQDNPNYGLIFNRGGIMVWQKEKTDSIPPSDQLNEYLKNTNE